MFLGAQDGFDYFVLIQESDGTGSTMKKTKFSQLGQTRWVGQQKSSQVSLVMHQLLPSVLYG